MSCLRVVVLGRPNVGKSTLFNRLLGYRKSIVHDRPGVTRDRVVERTTWYTDYGRFAVELCDTGGVGEGPFRDEIARQVQIALSDADIGLFVVEVGLEFLAVEQCDQPLGALIVQDALFVLHVAMESGDLLFENPLRALIQFRALAREHFAIHHRAFNSRRAVQRRVFHVAGLFAEDGP